LPVDLFVPGCPPHPMTILDGLLRLLGGWRGTGARGRWVREAGTGAGNLGRNRGVWRQRDLLWRACVSFGLPPVGALGGPIETHARQRRSLGL